MSPPGSGVKFPGVWGFAWVFYPDLWIWCAFDFWVLKVTRFGAVSRSVAQLSRGNRTRIGFPLVSLDNKPYRIPEITALAEFSDFSYLFIFFWGGVLFNCFWLQKKPRFFATIPKVVKILVPPNWHSPPKVVSFLSNGHPHMNKKKLDGWINVRSTLPTKCTVCFSWVGFRPKEGWCKSCRFWVL